MRFVGRLEREQHPGEAAVRARQEQVTAGLRLESGGRREGACARIEPVANGRGQVAAFTKVIGTVAAAWPRGRKIGCIGESSMNSLPASLGAPCAEKAKGATLTHLNGSD